MASRNINIVQGLKKRQPKSKVKLEGVSESDKKVLGDNEKIQVVLQDSIAKTCIHILTSLVNQNMKVTSKNKKIEDVINLYNRNAKAKRKIYTTLQYSIVNNKIKVFDTSTYKLVYDTILDEFLGIFQDTTYKDPAQMKLGIEMEKQYRNFLDKDLKNLVLVPGVGRGLGESLLLPAYPYVVAKNELLNNLSDLVKRLGLLTVITLDFPGDIGDSEIDDFLAEVQEMIEEASPNTIWVFPSGTDVEGVKGSGESKIIESVKVMIELLDEEIRKCLFVPDTFLTSLSANRATAKEQRYLIASMVAHIRDLIEEALIDVYDEILRVNGLLKEGEIPDYKFTWGNINLPEPETLFNFLIQLADRNGIKIDDEVRSYINLGSPTETIENPYSLASFGTESQSNQGQDIYSKMGYNTKSNQSNTQPKGGEKNDGTR